MRGFYRVLTIIAISRSGAKPNGQLQKLTLITQQGRGNFKTTDLTLKTLIGTDVILWEFPVNSTSFN